MTRKLCDQCQENSYMLFPCSLCGKSFCAEHRLPEKHGCVAGQSQNLDFTDGTQEPLVYDRQGYLIPSNVQQVATTPDVPEGGEYVWEPNITELPKNPFDPKSGVILKGVFWPSGKETFHILIAAAIMFLIGYMTMHGVFQQFQMIISQNTWMEINFLDVELAIFPFLLAGMVTAGFLIHEFAHRQVGVKYDLPAKFRLLTIGVILTVAGIALFLLSGGLIPPFALPGAVVVIGLEQREQAGKCKAAGPISNLVVCAILLPTAFVLNYVVGFHYFYLFLIGAYVNAFLGFFNCIPVGLLDGRMILKWKKPLWVFLFFGLLALVAFAMILMIAPPITYAIINPHLVPEGLQFI